MALSPYTWEQLARATLRRQFPAIRGRGQADVVELVRRVGPIQSQVARPPFVAVSSRLPGASYADINAAYEDLDLVRGSNLRGTVHTCVRGQHPILDTVTRRTLANLWCRSLKVERVSVEDCRSAMEDFGRGEWRSPDELRAYLASWLADHESEESAAAGKRFAASLSSGQAQTECCTTTWPKGTATATPIPVSACCRSTTHRWSATTPTPATDSSTPGTSGSSGSLPTARSRPQFSGQPVDRVVAVRRRGVVAADRGVDVPRHKTTGGVRPWPTREAALETALEMQVRDLSVTTAT